MKLLAVQLPTKMELSLILLLFMNFFLGILLTSTSAKIFEKSMVVPTFLENLVTTFHNCEIVYVSEPSSNENSIPGFGNVHFSNWNVKSAGVLTVSIGANVTYPRHTDIHRFSHEHCSLGVISINKFDNDIETWMVNSLIPRYGPILQKDKDHFVFIHGSEKVTDQIMLSPRFGVKIKYKLAIIQVENKSVICKTVDLYGKGGQARFQVLQSFTLDEFNDSDHTGIDLFPDYTHNFNGKAFRFAIPKVAFRFEIEMRADGKYHPKRGFYKWWLDEAMLKFNFTYDIFWASFGGGTGKLLKNGTWVGATGDLYYGKADCSFIVGEIYSRHKFLGWSSSISYEWVIFMTHIPRNSYSPKAIFKPFTILMWILFFLSLVLMTLALKSLAVLAADPESKNIVWGYLNMFEYMYCTLMEQDQVCPHNSHSIRVLCAFWLMFAMITATAYRGKLVSLIAFPVTTWVPSTFEELANSNFKVGLNVVGKAGAAYVLIATSTSPVFRTLTKRMELIAEAETCLEKAMREDFGCIIWKGIADYAMVKNLTDKNGHVPLQESTQIALFIGDGLVYERRAIFGEHFDRTIQAAMQMGLTIKWLQLDETFIMKERKTWESRSNITRRVYQFEDGGPKKLVVSQFSGVFLLCSILYIVSAGLIVHEYFKSKREINADLSHLASDIPVSMSPSRFEQRITTKSHLFPILELGKGVLNKRKHKITE